MDLKKLIREVLENKDCCTATKPTKAPILNEGMQSRVLMTENMQYHIDNKKPLYETTLPYGSKEYLDLWVEARYLYSRGALNVEGIDKEKITETDLGEYGIFEGQIVPLDMPMLEENSIEEVKLTSAGVMDMVRRVFKDPKLLKFLTFNSFKDFLAFIKGGSLDDYYDVKNDIEQYDQQLAEGILTEAEYQGRKVQLGKPMQGDVKKFKVYVKNDKGKVVKVNFGFGGKSAKGKRMVIKDKNPKRRAAFRARHNCKNPGPRWKARYWSCKAW
jgi:hypothetical protein